MRILKYLLPVLLVGLLAGQQAFAQARIDRFSCEDPFSLCTERQYNRSFDPDYKGRYIGHDEPSLLFYSNLNGSGNHYVSKLVLPTDPSTFPTDANPHGTGGPTVWNSGMAWHCATRNRFLFLRISANQIRMTTSTTAEIHIRRVTSAGTRVARFWSCSFIRQVG